MAISHLEQRDAGVWQAIAAEDRPVLVLLYAALTVEMVFFIVLGPLLPTYADDLDLSTSAAGLLAAAYSLGCGLAAIPAGLLVARIGARPVAVGGLALIGAACAGFALADAIVALDVARIVQGIGAAGLWAGAVTWLLELSDGAGRGRLVGLAFSAAGVGAALGPAVGALAGVAGSRIVFLALSASILALAVLGVALARARPGAGGEPPARPRVRTTLTRPVAGALGLVALPSVAFGIAGVLVPLRLHDLGAAVAAISAAYLVAAVVEAATQPVIGRWYDARGAVQVLRVTLAASAAALVVLATGLPEWPLLVALAIAWPIFSTVWVPALAELTRRVEGTGGQHGVALGLFMACWACFQALGAIGGSALEAVGGAVPFLLLAAAYVAVAART
jgi:MFS transporter, DHA1 family, multidrug resistance protein